MTAPATPAAGRVGIPAPGTNRCDITDLPAEMCAHCLPVPTTTPVTRAPRPSRRVLRPCGTQAAYARHLAHGETPCAACRADHTKADRRLRETGTTVERRPAPAEPTAPAPLTDDQRRAALTVAARAHGMDDARQLLNCLGLLGGGV